MTSVSVGLGDKSLLAALEADAYLAYAAVAPVSRFVKSAIDEFLRDCMLRGQPALFGWYERRERLREKLSALVDTSPEQVAFTGGTTQGLNALALCFPWVAGDTVLLTDGEFPANVVPFQNAARLFGLRVRFLPKPDPRLPEQEFLLALEAALREKVRLVSMSAVCFQSGLRMPIEQAAELCHRYGAELAVDAIQALGVVPLSVRKANIDYLAGGAHKWLMGVEGAGFLYARAECAERLVPRNAGWLSHEDGLRFLFEGPGELRYDRPLKSRLQFLEGSSMSSLGFAALEAALDPIQELSVPRVFAHVNAYLDALEPGLVSLGFASARATDPARRSGILSVAPPRGVKSGELAAALRKRRIIASTPDGFLRFAPHFPNSLDEIPLVLSALDESLRELGSARSLPPGAALG
ncbi:MAG: aminotransferase class V-fold PLP-dependent enzyme [Polyangiaceae bacterium]